MKRAVKLIAFPRRQVALRQGIPLLLVYGLLFPYQLRLFRIYDEMQAARELFRSSQLMLAFLTLWPLFCFFLPVYHLGARETLRALRHPVVPCALCLALTGQMICIPLYGWMLWRLPQYREIVGILLFQSACLTLLFALLLYLLRAPVIAMTAGLLYLCLSIPLADARIPLLLRPGRLLDGFGADYWALHGMLAVGMAVFLFAHARLYRPSKLS